MVDIERAMAAYYSARAPEYDRVYEKPEGQADIVRLQRWIPSAFEAASVLEVACGTGYWTQFIAPHAARMVGLDISVETLLVARNRLPSNVSLIAGDAYRLPLQDRSFDAAFVGFWLSHVARARRQEFLVELHRTLAAGATVVLVDNLYVEGSNQRISERDELGNTYQQRRLEDGSVHVVLKNFPTERELAELADVVGARRVEYRAWEYYWALTYVVPNTQ